MLICNFVSVLLGVSVAIAIRSGKPPSDNCGMLRGNSTERRYNLQILGTDYENSPVLFPLGKWDVVWLVNHPEELKLYTRNRFQLMEDIKSEKMFKRFTNQTWRSDLCAVIVDFDGLNLRQMFVEPAVKLALQNINDLQLLIDFISYGVVVNANHVAHQLLNIAKPLASSLMERVEIHGTNSRRWIPQLLKKIPRSQLPLNLGGFKDFKPIATCDQI
ncbi:unnamed protein product [Allacma fusca]|uniref:CRAL-TRIO domain-containing protein n=1 Tax=Allacma fusca TaxID=39272 RepID=A0A8J2KJR8_9HEXA|nr:unnamed protein product [Allacma fusca]